nr:hypothetical protein [Verrucomicrobiota bacterium]
MSHSTRRQFLTLAAGLTILPLLRAVRAAEEKTARPRLAIVGSIYNAQSMLGAPQAYGTPIVALCDPDRRNVEKNFAAWKTMAEKLAGSQKEEERALAEKFLKM